MSFDFNADDIFEMAEQLERNGAKFYTDASENVADPTVQKISDSAVSDGSTT